MNEIALLNIFAAAQMDSSQTSGLKKMGKDPLNNCGPLADQPLSIPRPTPFPVGVEGPASLRVSIPLAPLRAFTSGM